MTPFITLMNSAKARTLRHLTCLAAVLLLTGGITPALAQGSTASISGTVKDSTGAVLPGVEITITNTATAQSRVAVTSDAGRYNAPLLQVGTYEIRAELTGFQTAVRKGIELLVGQEAVVNFTMGVGEISEEVVVSGEAPLVNTTSSTLSDVINEIQVHDLPLNTRDLTQLGLLTPGVVQLRTGVTGGVTLGAPSVRISVGGAKFYSTGFLLDGTDVTDSSRGMGPGGAAGSMFGVETIKEFQVITNNYSAEYGRFAGGIMSMVTKNGTNDFHGSLFWFHRNDNLDASNFFDNKFGNKKPEFRRHQFGATVGGPIVKDKTFFFSSYEGFRQALGQTVVGLVPSVEAKQGIFPATNRGCTADLSSLGFSYDAGRDKCVIPIKPSVLPFLALYPNPNGAARGITGDLIKGGTEPTAENFFTGRVDHAFSESDSFFARFTSQKGKREPVSDGQGSFLDPVLTNLAGLQLYSTMEWKHIFSPHTINTARFGAQRNRWEEKARSSGPLNIGFFPGRPQGDILVGDGVIHAGLRLEGQNISNQFSYADDLFLTRGRQNIKLGVLITRHQTNDFTIGRGGGSFTFNSVAEFVAGSPFQWMGKIPADNSQRGARQTVLGFYIQDDFKWTSNFTLNLGLRYEPSTTPTEVNGLLTNLRNPLVDTAGIVGDPYFKTPSRKNFAPRIGFAWDPFGNGKTSIRSGFGIFHETILPYHYTGQIRRSPPFALEPVVRDRASLTAQFPKPPAEALTALNNASGILDFQIAEFEPSQPYMMQWNLSLQREVTKDFSLTAAYVGSRGVHMAAQRNLNTRVPEILPDGRKLFRTTTPRRNPAWTDLQLWDFATNSFYNGLQLGARKRFSSGIQFQIAYTFGRSIDSASSINQSDIQDNGSKQPQDGYNYRSNQGLSDHDVRHSFSANYTYELPIHGFSGPAKHLLEGWQLNGILSLSTGNPYKVSSGSGGGLTDIDRDADTTAAAPSLKPGANNNPVLSDGRNPDKYFDPTPFIVQNPGFYSDVARNTLIGPGVATFDLSLFKNTNLVEGVKLQFRAEFFNLFNRANFGAMDRSVFSSATSRTVPCSTYGSTGPDAGCSETTGFTYRPTVGRITRTRTDSRQIQLGLRLIF